VDLVLNQILRLEF